MIFVLSNPDDAHCQYVSEILTRKGVCHLLFDFSTYPKKSSISFEVSVDSNFVRLSVGQNLIDCRDVKSVWNRRKGAPSPPIGVNSQNVREYITRESQFFLDSLCLFYDLEYPYAAVNRFPPARHQLRRISG